jgi:hypothetical protein
MKMKVAIHQPEFLPWPGFFHKMSSVDLYVVLDNVQFRKNYFQNRNRIFCPSKGETYLTTPVDMNGFMGGSIRDMRLSNHENGAWRVRNWRILENNYRNHPYFKAYACELNQILLTNWPFLLDQNLALIDFFRKEFEIVTPMLLASELETSGDRTGRLVEIVRACGGDTYLSGPSGVDYLDIAQFTKVGIKVEFHEFSPPVYQGEGFRPYLSSLDLLMNLGPNSKNFVVNPKHLVVRGGVT